VLIKVFDAQGNLIVDESKAAAERVGVHDIKVKDAHLWDNHHPYLYQLFVELRDQGGQLLEVVPYRFGFRRVEINADHVVLLNGQRL
ncbi:hypothetical protein L0O74_12535, partial [Bifidobacterium longum]|nr:hypothetical protein [Bifidobacterium longum]